MLRSPAPVLRLNFGFGLFGRLRVAFPALGRILLLVSGVLLPVPAAFSGFGIVFVFLSGIVVVFPLVFAHLLSSDLEPVHEEVLQQDLDLALVLLVDGRLPLDVVDQQDVGVLQDREVLKRFLFIIKKC